MTKSKSAGFLWAAMGVRDYKRAQRNFGMETFVVVVLIVVVVSHMCSYVKTDLIIYVLNMYSLLYINYTSKNCFRSLAIKSYKKIYKWLSSFGK